MLRGCVVAVAGHCARPSLFLHCSRVIFLPSHTHNCSGSARLKILAPRADPPAIFTVCPCSVRVGARRGREASVRVSRLVGKLLFGMPRVGEHLPPRERRGLCISNPSVYIPVESVPLTRSQYMIADSHPPRQTATALQPKVQLTQSCFWYLHRRTLFTYSHPSYPPPADQRRPSRTLPLAARPKRLHCRCDWSSWRGVASQPDRLTTLQNRV